ncbi:MAG: imidazole glycerol phosphate synthase subunit HisH [Lachnospiraceae bacterium]
MIVIIDYDAGNIRSVEKAIVSLGEEAIISRDKAVILAADKIILPGVGSFGDAMEKLIAYELVDVIKEAVRRQIPFLGICLGMQLLFEKSEESNGVMGLCLLEGEILRIPEHENLKVPHMGWNSLALQNNSTLFKELDDESYVYFVHSYYLAAKDPSIVTATTEYNVTIHAAVQKEYIYGCQFHPEKSSDVGLKILANFISS